MKVKGLLGAILLNLLMALIEFIGGAISGSLSLISDALHNVNDVFSLVISYVAEVISKNKKSNSTHTYGYRRVEILSALLNGILLLLIFVFLISEAIQRFKVPTKVDGVQTIIIGFIGLIGNIVGAYLIHEDSHHNLNIKGAFLHLISDAFSSVGVIIGAILILMYNLYIADTIISLVIAGFIFYSAFGLIKDTLHILMEGTPRGIDIEALEDAILKVPGVRGIHHVHVWQVSSKDYLLSAHIVLDNQMISSAENITSQIKNLLEENFGINHSTLEVELEGEKKECQCEY
ncbi:MAG TPA: cation diffusion facilitator family transporter [Dictyoglomaceae bacterium]|nr:cation diffusion facilitator family transporter [Dictyoglomaceae bacterium]HOL39981.1 cation diffusion facilitator family transporter [Dictyoglomaceae bacterium]HPP16571.1 cation diffusion facilitator family transporter [Dictyoglomaceae bacterium]